MNFLKKALIFYLAVFLIGIAALSFLDDPSHFLHPQSECPLCQLQLTLVIYIPFITIFFSFNVCFLLSTNFLNLFSKFFPPVRVIRGPPVVHFLSSESLALGRPVNAEKYLSTGVFHPCFVANNTVASGMVS